MGDVTLEGVRNTFDVASSFVDRFPEEAQVRAIRNDDLELAVRLFL